MFIYIRKILKKKAYYAESIKKKNSFPANKYNLKFRSKDPRIIFEQKKPVHTPYTQFKSKCSNVLTEIKEIKSFKIVKHFFFFKKPLM